MLSALLTFAIPLFILDLFITATRASVQKADYARLSSLSEEKGVRLDRALELVKRGAIVSDSLSLALMLIRFTIAGLILNNLKFANPASEQNVIALLIALAIVLWLSEFLIERRVRRAPEAWMLRLAPIARFLALLLSPILALPVAISKRANGDEPKTIGVTEDEIKTLLDTGEKEGVLEQDERQMIFSIFQFGDTLAREIMVPRIDMFALDVDTPINKAAAAVLESGYSRVPVYEDKIDNILGLLYTKDMLKVWLEGSQYKSLRDLLRPANFIPESKKVDDLLAEMQAEHIHIAIVADEYGGVAGLVTLEDIVEEIVGEIQDEYDQGEEALFQKINDHEYIFLGRIDLDDVNEMLGVSLPTEEADTLGGFIYNHLGRVPKASESLQVNGLTLNIEQISGRRIQKVRASIIGNRPDSSNEEVKDD